MNEEFIQLPNLKEIHADLENARQDIDTAVQEDPNLASLSSFLIEIIEIIKEKTSKIKSIEGLKAKEKIDLAAHLTLFNTLMEELFLLDLDEEEFDEEFEEEEER